MARFLLAVDGSESSIWAAAHIAERIQGGDAIDLHVLNVQPIRPIHPALRKIVSQAMMQEYARTHAEEAFRDVKAQLDERRIAYSTHVAFDQPAFGITNHVHSLGVEHVIMGTRGSTAFVRFALGSVASRVVNMVDVPITLVPRPYGLPQGAASSGSTMPGLDGSTRATLVPVDGSEFSDRAVELAIQESSTGAAPRIVLLNVQSPYPSGPGWDDVLPADLEQAYRDAGVDSMRSARRKLDEAGCAYEAESLVGAPADVIAQRAREVGCNRIIMGTRGLGEGGSFFLGSVAVRVVHLAGVPVTLVK